MADSYVNKTGLQYFYNKLKTIFATQAALEAVDDRIDDIVAEGGEPNVIEKVTINGTEIQPVSKNVAFNIQKNGTNIAVSNKTVNVVVPTKVSDLTNDSGFLTAETDPTVPAWAKAASKPSYDATEISYSNAAIGNTNVGDTINTLIEGLDDIPASTSDIYNDGDGTSPFATQAYVNQNGGKIDKIQVNGTDQAITNKTVNISVPTKVSDITNDSGYQTASDVASAISTAVASAYKYKGSVATVQDLPASGNTAGDVYDVQSTGVNYAWTGSAWDALGSYVDVSLYWAKSELTAVTTAEIDTITAA